MHDAGSYAYGLTPQEKPFIGRYAVGIVWCFNLPPLIPVIIHQPEIIIRDPCIGRVNQ